MPARRSDFRKLILLFVMAGFVATVQAQTDASEPGDQDRVIVHESAKASSHDEFHMHLGIRDGRFEARNASVVMLLDYAYGLGFGGLVSGGPDWIRSARFDVDAPVAPGDDAATFGRTAQPGLIAALQQGFHLTAHVEARPGYGLELVVARGRPRLKAAALDNSSFPHIRPAGLGVLEGRGASMDELALSLTTPPMAPIVNSTGLTGRYDFTLHWSPAATVNRDDGAPERYNMDGSISARVSDTRCVPGQEASGCNVDDALPSLAMALQAELGLKLEPAKKTVQALVIDHIERPSRQ